MTPKPNSVNSWRLCSFLNKRILCPLIFSIDNLRRKFQSYQLRYTYKMKTDADVPALIGQFDGQLHDALEKLAEASKAARLYRESTSEVSPTATPSSPPSSSAADDSGELVGPLACWRHPQFKIALMVDLVILITNRTWAAPIAVESSNH